MTSKKGKPLRRAIERQLERAGLRMSKQISSGGLFGNSTYDTRTVYSIEDLNRLNSEGFKVESDVGVFLLNAFLNYEED